MSRTCIVYVSHCELAVNIAIELERIDCSCYWLQFLMIIDKVFIQNSNKQYFLISKYNK